VCGACQAISAFTECPKDAVAEKVGHKGRPLEAERTNSLS
jgi:hypothetical protein